MTDKSIDTQHNCKEVCWQYSEAPPTQHSPARKSGSVISERTFAAGLVCAEPTEGGAGGFSSREVEGVAQRLQTGHRTANVRRGQRVRRHEPVAVAVQHHILRLEATPILTAKQHLRAAAIRAAD